MSKKESAKSITFILAGCLLHFANGISGGWASCIISMFGFILMFQGLSMLKANLDSVGQGAVGLLVIAVMVGGVASLLDMIPIIGMFSSILFVIAFIIELTGYLRLRQSKSLGQTGRSGANMLIFCMVMAIIASLFGLLPFIGGYITASFIVIATIVSFYAWIQIQDALVEGA
jgi:hypothetical protein